MKYVATGHSIAYASRENQDAWEISGSNSDHLVAAIADGVGGHRGGAAAARTAALGSVKILDESPNLELESLFNTLADNIAEIAALTASDKDMATTLSVVELTSRYARFAHVGDSRIYHLRGNGIVQVTEDQTEVALLLRQGILSPARAKAYARRSVLLSALSARKDHATTVGEINIQAKDRLILLTDGAYRALSKKKLRDISVAHLDIFAVLDSIKADLMSSELRDDATIIVVEASE